MIKKTLLALAAVFLSTPVYGATIVWNAASDAGLSLPNGNMLPVGNLVRMGIFDISDAQIQQNKFDLLFLDSHFMQLGEVRIGDNVGGSPGYWAASNNVDTKPSVSNLGGKQIMLWGFAAPNPASKDVAATLSSATNYGIFYADKSLLSNWAVPTDPEDGIPGVTTIDLGNLTGAGARKWHVDGSRRNRRRRHPAAHGRKWIALNAPNVSLSSIPEPTTVGLFAFGGLALFGRRRRC